MEVINLEINEGTDYSMSVTYRDELTNLPVNITGYDATLDIKQAFGNSTYLFELTPGNGLTLGGSLGTIDITISSEVTNMTNQPSPWERGAYSLVLTDLLGKKILLLKGFLTIIRN